MTSLPLTSLSRRGDGQIAHLASEQGGKKCQVFKMGLPWFPGAAIDRWKATYTPPKYALPSLSMTTECCQTGQRSGTAAEQHTAMELPLSLPPSAILLEMDRERVALTYLWSALEPPAERARWNSVHPQPSCPIYCMTTSKAQPGRRSTQGDRPASILAQKQIRKWSSLLLEGTG